MKFPFYKQHDQTDCGPTCLRMIAKFYGRSYSLNTMRQITEIGPEGVSFNNILKGAKKIGLDGFSCQISLEGLYQVKLPCILHWRGNHFIVLYKIKKNNFFLADPLNGLVKMKESDFLVSWQSKKFSSDKGLALFFNPLPEFCADSGEESDKINWRLLSKYLTPYKKLFSQLILGLLVGSLIQLIIPFLTQSIIDVGIGTGNFTFIYLVILAQATLIIGRSSINFIRSWILLHISTRINISILTDFLIKLMRLPINFFDSKKVGDILQRTTDQRRIESFLTGSTLTTIFSVFNLIVFTVVLIMYSVKVFIVFMIGNFLYTIWIISFLKRRRTIDYQRFDISSTNQSTMIQIVNGMQEIKLNNYENEKRWEWETLQARTFKFSIKALSLNQFQQGGSILINESTGLLITFLSAQAVINNEITLGTMVAIQYIIGQLNMPIQQFISFAQSFQDAKISLERLNEIFELDDEESLGSDLSSELPTEKSIKFEDVSFRYQGSSENFLFKNLNLSIPEGKVTAIVGMSGSGKTTILKLLLRFYEVNLGVIKIGDHSLSSISFETWRAECGVVMQDGFIFSDTIRKNITLADPDPDDAKIKRALIMANIEDFVSSLPIGIDTKIGAEGTGLSQGQRQRILIARAIYKNPSYIFFDEATNALDSTNEKIIIENLNDFFRGKTVVIVAHRLSTVKNANNIIVLENGCIVEQGTHSQLVASKGQYYALVQNQLELGT
ncbi:peptidase domain-containing ABC transporter [Mucilaginibacter sp. KACC 22063]|uniref:peptidase domain-containing ABC transporter n=1 Tax=Mucilaginibacter sp. KACC 22063 TaxID=3025666 RepID=UPI002366E562|nr:peptidase domain-containing ABC transporter [Mucilaginibacter sp. KACC 22063]WDF55253.1 peptidase domain-containing ABC transporter [Mucilaginibacter sp. KACC 22063]